MIDDEHYDPDEFYYPDELRERTAVYVARFWENVVETSQTTGSQEEIETFIVHQKSTNTTWGRLGGFGYTVYCIF